MLLMDEIQLLKHVVEAAAERGATAELGTSSPSGWGGGA